MDITLRMPPAVAARIKAGFEHEGWKGTNPEAVDEFKTRTIRHWKSWLRAIEHDIQEAAITTDEVDIT